MYVFAVRKELLVRKHGPKESVKAGKQFERSFQIYHFTSLRLPLES